MNFALHQKILKENVSPSVCDLKLECIQVLQQDNDLKHTSKSTSERLKKKTNEGWSGLVINPIKMLWHDPNQAVCARPPKDGTTSY